MKIHPDDNVEVLADGHKRALVFIPAGTPVVKYGLPIGHATADIPAGAHVHSHNMATDLAAAPVLRYDPKSRAAAPHPDGLPATFCGFVRADGRVGVRNDLWIVPAVGCVNALAQRLAAATGAFALTHPYGCSQLGADHETTANLLAALVRHPNAGGVLVLSLGCENNTPESFRARIGEDFAAHANIRFLRAQDPGDEYARGLALLAELDAARQAESERVEIPVERLVVGLKCGGSDGLSGITANPLVGRFADLHTALGGSVVLTETPEMFGAESVLASRCASQAVFDRFAAMIADFRDYYARNGQPVYENPSPGNKAGGITTLEEKSLGCVQKGGSAPVLDVLPYGAQPHVFSPGGLTLLAGPGNDIVSSTALAAAGCHIVLFTTGRGTPLGTVVPTFKIASNTALAAAKPHWIDWDAERRPDARAFARAVYAAASGAPVCNERAGIHDIAVFKNGITL